MANLEITKGVWKISRPKHVQVGLTPGFNRTVLNVIYYNGFVKSLPISKKVAEVLIANDYSYEG